MQLATRATSATTATVVLSIALLPACGPGNITRADLTPKERGVVVLQRGEKPECAYSNVGVLEATSGTAFSMGTFESTTAKLQQQAAEMGADGITIIDHTKNGMADQATAQAWRCRKSPNP